MAFAILSTSLQIAGQHNELPENKKLMFGFNIGANYSNVLAPGNPSARSNNGGGFSLGLVMSESISEQLFLSPKAELSFNDCNIVYSNAANAESIYPIYPVSINIMMHIAYRLKKSKRSAYLLIGPNARVPLVENRVTNVYGNNPDLAIDLGFGFEKLLKYFCLAPEFRYSIGLLNVNKDPGLDHVYFHNITFVLNFKG